MTENSPSLSTQIAPPSQTVYLRPLSAAPPALQKEETVEEEPYTIKCICDFSGDDGTTIYCDTCDTWQHIECYYPENVADALREDFAHSCADCKPRPLDKQKAIERQRYRLTIPTVKEDTSDKKPKRPPSKSHKKRPKPTDLQLNGHPAGTETVKHPSPHDHHPPSLSKKTKSSHKSHHSTSAQPAKRSPSHGNVRAQQNGHPPSPADTPPDRAAEFEVHGFSEKFRSLYSNEDFETVNVNSFASLHISNMISSWLRDPETMRAQTGHELTDVFEPTPPSTEALKRNLLLETKRIGVGSDVITWQYLKTPTAIDKDMPLIELNGQIGIQKEYCDDPANRWTDFTSPLPFVFFHPLLPLYIDTRREGSRARYVRRSCKPNATLESYLSGRSEYHFWLVSDRAIAANEQITLAWDFRLPNQQKARMLRLLGLGDDETNGTGDFEMDDAEYIHLSNWLYPLLSEYGGCACDLGNECAFVRFHRNYLSRGHMRPNATKKKARKPKPHTISPTSTGRATNSRAASEGHLDDIAEIDGRSVSGSSRSKPPSRDMTPARQGSFDAMGILTEPTDRDKRKVAMVEDSFRRMEQQQPVRKKKRISDGTSSSKTKSTLKSPAIPSGSDALDNRHYVDAGTSRTKSDSPMSASSMTFHTPLNHPASPQASAMARSRQASAPPRANYVDASVQTDPVEGEWYSCSVSTPKPKRRRVISLSKRLLDNRHKLRSSVSESSSPALLSSTLIPALPTAATSTMPMDLDVPPVPSTLSPLMDKHSIKPPELVSPSLTGPADVAMADAPAASPNTLISPPLPSPSTESRSPDLRVQLPPVPAFTGAPGTSLSASSPIVQSPFSTNSIPSPFGPPALHSAMVFNPSPVKKKLSLSDYTKSRMNKAASGRPALGAPSLKSSASGIEEPTSATSVDMATAAESPTIDKAETTVPTNNPGDPLVNGAA